MKRRSLVLTTEGARHPFRRALMPHVTRMDGAGPTVARPVTDMDKDWKLFVMSFAAFFTAFYAFIF